MQRYHDINYILLFRKGEVSAAITLPERNHYPHIIYSFGDIMINKTHGGNTHASSNFLLCDTIIVSSDVIKLILIKDVLLCFNIINV